MFISAPLSILVISDGQVKPDECTRHWAALGRMAAHLKPDVIVNIGDFWDMPSLSTHEKDSSLEFEGKRYHEDLWAGEEAMRIFLDEIKSRKKKMPRLVFCIGNHEHRITRFVNENKILNHTMSISDLYLDDWEVFDFLKPVVIGGVAFAHYFYNPMSGRPYGGTMQNKLNRLGYSFVMGHTQAFGFARKDMSNGQTIMGMVTGAYYRHDESYKGPQGNHHWRGVVLLHDVKDGCYDFETWSIDRVMKNYG